MRLKETLLGTMAAIAMAGAAQADYTSPTGWYMSLGAGTNWMPDNDIDEYSASGSLSTTNSFSWESGYIVSGAVGYDFGRNWRVEFEVAYRDNDVDTFFSSGTGPYTASGADLWQLSQMVNVLYDFDLGGNFSAAVGAGVGGNLVVFNPGCSGNFEGQNCNQETDDYVVAGQLIAQAAYQFADRWHAVLDYRYMLSDDAEVVNLSDRERWDIESSNHSVLLGLRFDLQRDGAVPERPRQTGEAPKQFIVFFGFNKSNLTTEASRVVSEAAAAAKQYGSASITVVGHTDTVGSNDYNLRLSMARSQSVKEGLIANGIAASMISTGGRGEAELMVQTGDSVKEPQNRRATIDLN
jgi:outer membrane protein OmpA-like peptidoglycan-associated protein